MTVSIALIAAIAENGVIGRDNDMPWKLSSDLKRFKTLTMAKPVVIGRRTFQSIGRPLPGRPNIVVTRNPDFSVEGIHVVASLDEGLDLARKLAAEAGADEVMVLGGGTLYEQSMASADVLYITEVHATPEGDTHFPEISPDTWREVSREACPRGERDNAGITFITYRRADG
ncbi:dihydrofolate reductase [Breoghania sp.]|uniref:dihydrofolate reductase n=1 Tax=Breoghania sp. TaxID=2065378 RepID=UPI002624A1C1|nr:dihydrofolate reductase [Breoghania sp.]MDJ0931188.1 dihydrofolate reductase [Breoghania sp.]